MSVRAQRISRPSRSTAQERAAARRAERRVLCERKGAGRAKNFFYLTLVIASLLTLRLGYLQIVRGSELGKMAREQHSETIEVFARRGTIYDRARGVLARSSPSVSVYVDPHDITNRRLEAEQLAPLVHISASYLEGVFEMDSRFQWIRRKISADLAKRIRALKLPGVELEDEDTGLRTDPSGRLASHVLGFVGIDENGLDGLEYEFDSLLRGTSGKKTIEVGDGSGPIPFGKISIDEVAKPGRSLVLTIDPYLQYMTEVALREAVHKYNARSGSVIVMNPKTGEVLALANMPDFDPNSFGKAAARDLPNRALTDPYEPGSTFKLITAAAALENGTSPDARFNAIDVLPVGGATIHNAEDGMMAGGHGTESIEDIIAYSHNVGAAEIGMSIGKRAMMQMIDRFGFQGETKIDLPGESDGIVPGPDDWSGSTLPTVSFGHGISVTLIALARAYCAIANGGTLLRPRVVSDILNPDGTVLYHYGTEVEGHPITPHTAAVLRRYLRAVVVRGTGNPAAHVAGFETAGKTGTAQVVEHGVYASGQYIASFAGYIPADNPRFVIVVKVDRPHGSIYGSEVAAPVFTHIAREAMLHDNVMPGPDIQPKAERP